MSDTNSKEASWTYSSLILWGPIAHGAIYKKGIGSHLEMLSANTEDLLLFGIQLDQFESYSDCFWKALENVKMWHTM